MLTKPDLADDLISACVHDSFGLPVSEVAFLPLGADVNSAVYRVTVEDGTRYFLKLRRASIDDLSVAIPALLHAQGIRSVMAPIATTAQTLSLDRHGFQWMLYPFFEGTNGFAAALSQVQWITLGASLKAIHAAKLPARLLARVPREDYTPRWRALVKLFHAQVAQSTYDDPLAVRLAAFWIAKSDEICAIVERAEQLAQTLANRDGELVLCHADLHAGNVLLGAHDALAIVDWDTLIIAPKERDLMFVGAGIGDVWNTAHEEAWFYQGYGPATLDPRALAYYRYERIVADIAAYAEQLFGVVGSVEDRAEGLRQLVGQFAPNSVVQIAHRSYVQLG